MLLCRHNLRSPQHRSSQQQIRNHALCQAENTLLNSQLQLILGSAREAGSSSRNVSNSKKCLIDSLFLRALACRVPFKSLLAPRNVARFLLTSAFLNFSSVALGPCNPALSAPSKASGTLQWTSTAACRQRWQTPASATRYNVRFPAGSSLTTKVDISLTISQGGLLSVFSMLRYFL